MSFFTLRNVLQDLSRLRLKIDRLEHLLNENNRLVATLRDSLTNRKGPWERRGGTNGSSTHLLPGCRLAQKMEDGADGVQVSLAC